MKWHCSKDCWLMRTFPLKLLIWFIMSFNWTMGFRISMVTGTWFSLYFEGWLEVVLDRRLIQDDWRGLSQGVKDNVLTRSQFVILFERKHPPQKQVCNLLYLYQVHIETDQWYFIMKLQTLLCKIFVMSVFIAT
jgi:hypothetical protein